jgi:hypothetical protein
MGDVFIAGIIFACTLMIGDEMIKIRKELTRTADAIEAWNRRAEKDG